MFARVSVYENVDLELTDRVKRWIESSGATRSATSRATAAR